ncbi:copper resistance protein CopC [Staphylococcus warneri]|nr:copper resistance protein CopC [Staphylococcus warneri]
MVHINKYPKIIIAIMVMFFLSLLPSVMNQASAHATLEKTNPKQDGVVKQMPEEIELEFNEPVNSKYSNITLYNDKGKELGKVKPSTSGWAKTLTFSPDKVGKGTHTIKWQAISADGHEVGDQFEFSVGIVTAKDIDTSSAFYAEPSFWFRVMRYIAEGTTIILVGLFWLNGIAKRRQLHSFELFPKQMSISFMMIMAYIMALLLYMMTLTSDVVDAILSLKIDVLMQFPFILSSIAMIVLYALIIIRNMDRIWYWLVSIVMILTISMSGHAWSQSIPIWSIAIRTVHIAGMTLWLGALAYLVWYIVNNNSSERLKNIRSMLFKVNTIAVAMIIISGVLMAIDETNILAIWSNMQTWTILILVKVIGTLIMMALGLYQTTKALGKRQQVNKVTLIIELIIGIILIFVGVMMSQINIPG